MLPLRTLGARASALRAALRRAASSSQAGSAAPANAAAAAPAAPATPAAPAAAAAAAAAAAKAAPAATYATHGGVDYGAPRAPARRSSPASLAEDEEEALALAAPLPLPLPPLPSIFSQPLGGSFRLATPSPLAPLAAQLPALFAVR